MNEVIVPGQIVWQSGVIGVAPYKPEPLARPCDTCGTNVSQAIDHDSVECFETCERWLRWSKERSGSRQEARTALQG